MRRRASGYDQAGNPGGVYSMSNPPPGKRFGAFVNGGKAIQWAPANAPISSTRGLSPARQSLLASPSRERAAPEDAVQMLFQALDADGDGVITKSELSAALTSSRGNSPGRRDFRARSPAEPPRGSARLGTPPRPASLRSRSPPASTARPGPGSSIADLDLYVAAALGQADEVTRLVGAGRNATAGLDGDTPLHAASGNGHASVVAVLLQAGVHPDTRIAGERTAMHTAVESNRDTVVATLLKGGADPEPVDAAGERPRDIAERLGHAICAAVIDKHVATHPKHVALAPPPSPAPATATSSAVRARRGSKEDLTQERQRLARERDETAAQMREKEREIAEMEAALERRGGSREGSRATSPDPAAPSQRRVASPERRATSPERTRAMDRITRAGRPEPEPQPEMDDSQHKTIASMGEAARTLSMAEQLEGKLHDLRQKADLDALLGPEEVVEGQEEETDPWAREANKILRISAAAKTATAAQPERPSHIDTVEISLSRLVPKVLRMEKLGRQAATAVDAIHAERADKEETDRHMEVGAERDAQLGDILRRLEKFEAVCSMVHSATSAKECEPLVKQRRQDCANLVGPVSEILALMKLRAEALTGRVHRLEAKIAAATDGLEPDDGSHAFEQIEIADAIAAFQAYFNLETDSGTTLCQPIVELIEEVRELTDADTSSYDTLSTGEAIHIPEVEARAAQRSATILKLLEALASGERKIHTFLRVGLRHFEAERQRVQSTAEKAAALDQLLSEKKSILERLPESEKAARKLLKSLRSAEKGQIRSKCRIRACTNRIEEKDEFGALSDESSDSDEDEDWDDLDFLSDLTPEQLAEKLVQFRGDLEKYTTRRKDAVMELKVLMELLPELRFHPKLRSAS